MRRIIPDRPLTAAEKTQRYRDRHKAKIKSRVAADKKANPQKYAAYTRKWRDGPGRLTRLVQLARGRAKKNGLDFSITAADLSMPTECPVLRIPISHGATGFNDNSPTIDRVDNSRGYVPGNVLVVSWRANRIKADATAQELAMVAEFYSRTLPRENP